MVGYGKITAEWLLPNRRFYEIYVISLAGTMLEAMA